MTKKLRLLLYCTKGKMKLRKSIKDKDYYLDNGSEFNIIPKKDYALNGKIVAECDFEVEKMEHNLKDMEFWIKEGSKVLYKQSCLDYEKIYRYLQPNKLYCGYAIHIKNLIIFDEPRELDDYYYSRKGKFRTLGKAPQNMMYVQEVVPFKEEYLIKGVLQEFRGNRVNEYILISIRPEWMCKILNGEKTIEVRKQVLKEMLK